jgi:hopanoid biosynthesis associated radical SAM protein HpnJ
MIADSKVVDAPPHKVSIQQTVAMAPDFELLVLFTSTPGFHVDVKIAEMMKDVNPKLRVAFVGPHVTVQPEQSLRASKAIDFIIKREFDYQIRDFAMGKPLEEIPGAVFRKNGHIQQNPESAPIEDLNALPWATKVYHRDLDFRRYNVPFLLNPYLAFYTSRGCPAQCTFCLWPQTHSGHRWRLRSSDDVVNECRWALENFPGLKEIFFDDDTFNYQKARTIELCKKLKELKFTWSCTSRVTTDYETLKAMKEAGCRLLIVGYESGEQQILKNIKKGATIDMARRFTANCKKLGLVIHGDFIIGLPGETHQSIRTTIDFAKDLDVETIQVSIAHPYPGTEFYDYVDRNGLIQIDSSMTDEAGHQLPNYQYPGLDRGELVEWVERFYGEFYFRPKVVIRLVGKAVFDGGERRRLIKEAREYLALRSKRKQFVKNHQQDKDRPAVLTAGD